MEYYKAPQNNKIPLLALSYLKLSFLSSYIYRTFLAALCSKKLSIHSGILLLIITQILSLRNFYLVPICFFALVFVNLTHYTKNMNEITTIQIFKEIIEEIIYGTKTIFTCRFTF